MKSWSIFALLGIEFVGGFLIVTSFSTMNLTNAVIGLAVAVGGFVFFGRSFRGRTTKVAVAIDFLSVALIAVFFLVMVIGDLGGLLGNNQGTQNVALFLLVMAFGGLGMTLISGVLRIQPNVSAGMFDKELLLIAGNFGAFFLLDFIVPPATYRFLGQPLAGLGPSSPIVTILISVPETIVFQVWLAPWLANVSKTGAIGGSFMAAIVASGYHLFVLGTQPAQLGIVFGAFFIIGYTAIKGGLASIPLVNHFVNNVLSVFGGI